MDINDNQQINTFLKGMNTDVSDALIESSQYRYAENLRLVTNTDSNEGELRLVDSTGSAYTGPWDEILSMTAIRDYLIVIAKTSYKEDGITKPGISIFTNRSKGSGNWNTIVNNIPYWELVYTEDGKPHFSLVTRWESDNNIKLYIASGLKPIITLNVTKSYLKYDGGVLIHNELKDILKYAEVHLNQPEVEIIPNGRIKSARVLYAYRLYNTGEPATNLSVLSRLVSLYKSENEGYWNEEVSNKGCKITINISTEDFSKIQLFRINYVLTNQPPLVSLVYDGSIVSLIMDYGTDIEQYAVDEFLAMQDDFMIPTVIESKQNYLFAANIKYRQDSFDELIKDLDFRSYSSGDFSDPYTSHGEPLNHNQQHDPENIDTYNELFWHTPQYGSSQIGGRGDIVDWEYVTEEVIVDTDNNIYKNGQQITDTIQSLLKGEVYRYGILLYNNFGTKSSVKWIADIMVPDGELPRSTIHNIQGLPAGWAFKVYGIKFTVKIPQDNQYNISGFEIVRCKHTIYDSKVISQGIIGIPERVYDTQGDPEEPTKTGYICPTGYMTVRDISNHYETLQDADYLQFASPEYAYQPDDIQDVLKSENNNLYILSLCSYTQPVINRQYTIKYSNGQEITWETKRFNSITHDFDSVVVDNRYSLHFNCMTDHVMRDDNGAIWGGALFTWLDSRNAKTTRETAITNVLAYLRINIENDTVNIDKCAFPEVPDPHSLYNDDMFAYKDAITPILSASYCQWVTPMMISKDILDVDDDMKKERRQNADGSSTEYSDVTEYAAITKSHWSPISSGGKCIVMKLLREYNTPKNLDMDYIAPITIANLRKHVIPYNGPDSYISGGPAYFSYGNYKDLSGQQSQISVFDGDSYPGVFIYHSAHCFDNSELINMNKQLIVYYVPVESRIELRATCGNLYPKVKDEPKGFYVQDSPTSIEGYSQDKDAYMFNTTYGVASEIKSYSQEYMEDIDANNYDVRVQYSNVKTNNEHVDSWSEFPPLNFLDVDTRFGEITNMRLFKDTMLYWQTNATGVLSINDRILLSDQNSNDIMLGTGDVLSRYDYISTVYGMKPNQYEAEIQSNGTQYWWDGLRKEILAFSSGLPLLPLTKLKGVRNYINTRNESSKPALIYDSTFDEIISNVVDNECVVYNEKIQQFTSIYTMTPLYRAVIEDTTIISNKSSLYHMNIKADNVTLLGSAVQPLLQYVINKQSVFNKVFDISVFGGRFYGGDNLNNITFSFNTPFKQSSSGSGNDLITNREYDFRLNIPRNNNDSYGGRMRGKTMQCELKSSSNSNDFSLQYIITKYRMSWS